MNNYDELLFNGKLKKSSAKTSIATHTPNTYRGLDVSEYPNFKNNMEKYCDRLNKLIDIMMSDDDDDDKHLNRDEHDIITMKFIEFSFQVFDHFDNLEKIEDVNKQFNIISKVDKVLLSNHSS